MLFFIIVISFFGNNLFNIFLSIFEMFGVNFDGFKMIVFLVVSVFISGVIVN